MPVRRPGKAVQVRDVGLDIQEWRIVQNIHGGGVDHVFIDLENFNNVDTDLVYSPG